MSFYLKKMYNEEEDEFEKYDLTEQVGNYQPNQNKFMTKIFRVSFNDVVGAFTSAVLVALICYVLKIGDVFTLDWHVLVNTAVMAGLGSLLKNLLTTDEGNFLGVWGVK